MMSDLSFAIRSLRKAPAFTAVVLLTLALGMGATVTLFSILNAVLLKPLEFRNPERLVTVLQASYGVSPANYVDWRDQSRSFDTLAAADFWTVNLTGTDRPERIQGLHVTSDLLPMLGVAPMFGRLFTSGEGQKGAEHEVILGYGLWQRRFAADRGILGKSILLDGESYTVIGIMPRGFKFPPFWAPRTELWAPLALGERRYDRGGRSLRLFGRLKTGVTLGQARADVAAITDRLEQQFPGTNKEVTVTPLLEKTVGEIRAPLLILMGAVGFVLLIACTNVAHMLLARSAARQREVSIRMALGAARARLVRQFLTESLLLAFLGGCGGLLLASWGTQILVTMGPTEIPRLDTVSLDVHVVLFTLAITLLTSVGFGLAPALQTSRVNINDLLKEGGRDGSDIDRGHLKSILVASEFALALALLVGAGLLIRSFFALRSVDPGFNPRHVLSMVVSVAGSRESAPGSREVFYRQLLERIHTIPVVESAAAINHLPLAGDVWTTPFLIEGRPQPAVGEEPSAVYRIATPDYFRTMQMLLLRGRDFSAQDTRSSPGVVVINERASLTYWPGENPVGQRIVIPGSEENSRTWLTVIGVVKDAKQQDWTAKPQPEIYLAAFQSQDFLGLSHSQISDVFAYITLVVRASGDPAGLTSAIENSVWSFDSNLPISNVVTMEGVVADANAQPRFQMFLLVAFAGVALALASVGIYCVMSYAVSRRVRELGVRLALGASRSDVFRLVIGQAMRLAVAGALLGILAAAFLARMTGKLLYGVAPTDPLTYIYVTALLLAVAALASYLPALRATRVDPVIAIRAE